MLRRLARPALAALALSACSSSNDASVSKTFNGARLASPEAWSGNQLAIISSAFALLDSLPAVTLGGVAATVVRVDDSTIYVQLPDADAALAVSVAAGGFRTFSSSVRVHGFQQLRIVPSVEGLSQAVPGGALVLVPGGSGLYLLNVATGSVVQQWPDTVYSNGCIDGVGPSYRPAHYVLYGVSADGRCFHPYVWEYNGQGLTRVDSFPASSGDQATSEIAPKKTLHGPVKTFYVDSCTDTGCQQDRKYFEAFNCFESVTIAALVDRAIANACGSLAIDIATGDTLYRVPLGGVTVFADVQGIDFSPGQDTMYAAANTFQNGAVSMASTSTGTLYAAKSFPGQAAMTVLRAPDRPALYVFLSSTTRAGSVLVLDSRTLATIAELRAPTSIQLIPLFNADQYRIVLDPSGQKLYVLETNQGDRNSPIQSSAKILTFGLVPP